MLVGGGRWGRVHASVLMKLLPPGSEILWVSRHNYSTVLASAAERQGQALVTVIESLEQAIKRKPNAAIVVTAADTHARVAQTLLEHGIPTLVEKPFVLNTKDAVDLIELASASEIVLGVGLHLLFASYLSHFRSLWQNRPVAIARLQWLDSEVETRYGEVKRIDVSTPKVHDVFPHLWAILRVLFPAHETLVGDVKSLAGGSACLQFTMGDVAIHAHIGRRASARSRRVDLTFLDGGTAMLDFTNEPGTVTLNGNVVASDPDWGHQPTPLTAEVSGHISS